jgi:hypothetical protein
MKRIWTGYLKVNYLTISVKVYSSTSAKAILFDVLHSVRKTNMAQENICPQCNKAVPKNEIILGYPYGKAISHSHEEYIGDMVTAPTLRRRKRLKRVRSASSCFLRSAFSLTQ